MYFEIYYEMFPEMYESARSSVVVKAKNKGGAISEFKKYCKYQAEVELQLCDNHYVGRMFSKGFRIVGIRTFKKAKLVWQDKNVDYTFKEYKKYGISNDRCYYNNHLEYELMDVPF